MEFYFIIIIYFGLFILAMVVFKSISKLFIKFHLRDLYIIISSNSLFVVVDVLVVKFIITQIVIKTSFEQRCFNFLKVVFINFIIFNIVVVFMMAVAIN